jgi:hypothetical protein
MPFVECFGVERKATFDILSGRVAGLKFQAIIAPLSAPGNFRGGRLQGAAIADRVDGSSYYYSQPNWSQSDDQRVKTLLDTLHDLAANWNLK